MKNNINRLFVMLSLAGTMMIGSVEQVKSEEFMSFDCYPEEFECDLSLGDTRTICHQNGSTEEDTCACGTSSECDSIIR